MQETQAIVNPVRCKLTYVWGLPSQEENPLNRISSKTLSKQLQVTVFSPNLYPCDFYLRTLRYEILLTPPQSQQ